MKESNYLTLEIIKKALKVKDGILTIDPNIIGFYNEKDLNKILVSMQARLKNGLPLEKITENLHLILNWRKYEFYPLLESKEKYQYQIDYWTKLRRNDKNYDLVMKHCRRMLEALNVNQKE